MQKKKLLISYKNLPSKLVKSLQLTYPYGFQDHLIKIENGQKEILYVVRLETEDTIYLVKVKNMIKSQNIEQSEEIPLDEALNDTDEQETQDSAEEDFSSNANEIEED